MARLGRPWSGLTLLILAHFLASPARAQTVLSASVESDYLLRGVTLSNGQPVISLGASYDHPSGAYGGLALVGGGTAHSGFQALGYVAYAGYAHRLKGGGSWDIGVTDTANRAFFDKIYASNYAEVYAGFSKNGVSAHVYYSPKYIGEQYGSLYFDLNDAVRISPSWRLFGHVGAFVPLDSESNDFSSRPRLDFRAGIAHEIGNAEIHVAWSGVTERVSYPEGWPHPRGRIVAGLSLHF